MLRRQPSGSRTAYHRIRERPMNPAFFWLIIVLFLESVQQCSLYRRLLSTMAKNAIPEQPLNTNNNGAVCFEPAILSLL